MRTSMCTVVHTLAHTLAHTLVHFLAHSLAHTPAHTLADTLVHTMLSMHALVLPCTSLGTYLGAYPRYIPAGFITVANTGGRSECRFNGVRGGQRCGVVNADLVVFAVTMDVG